MSELLEVAVVLAIPGVFGVWLWWSIRTPTRSGAAGSVVGLAVLSAAAGMVHAAVIGQHLREWWVFGVFFVAVATVQLGWAIWILRHPTTAGGYLAAAVGNLAVAAVWAVSRVTGLPIGPEPWEPEAVHRVDLLASAQEVVLAVAALRLWRHPPSGRFSVRHLSPAGRGLVVGLLAATGAVILLNGSDTHAEGLEPVRPDPGLSHVHALDINPGDGHLYAATHHGVFRITGRRQATRIANRYQDTMGFTVIGSDHFLASGHPDFREELPPLLGLIESTDAAETWRKRSLLGKADLHVIRYHAGTIYAYDSTHDAFMVSPDAVRWRKRSTITIHDFVVHPHDQTVVIAVTPQGLRYSGDQGQTWTPLTGPLDPILLTWEQSTGLWLATSDGQVWVSADTGASWQRRAALPGPPEAFHATRDALYAAVPTGILTSTNDARTWQTVYQIEPH